MYKLPLYPEGRATVVDKATPKGHNPNCTDCDLHKDTVSVCMPPIRREATNPENTEVLLVISDNPRADEDRSGQPYTSRSGRWIRSSVEPLWDGPIVYTYGFRCATAGRIDTKIKDAHINACRGYLSGLIKAVNPSRVLMIGQTSSRMVLDRSPWPYSIRTGYAYLENGACAYFMPTPVKAMSNRFYHRDWNEDIERALVNPMPPMPEYDASVNVIETEEEAEEACRQMLAHGSIACDTEFSGGLHTEFFEVDSLCVSLTNTWTVWAWSETALNKPGCVAPLRRVMEDPSVEFVAQNAKIEAKSLNLDKRLGFKIRDRYIDTLVRRKIAFPDVDASLGTMGELVGMGGHKGAMHEEVVRCRDIINRHRAEVKAGVNHIPGTLGRVLDAAVAYPGLDVDALVYALTNRDLRDTYCALDTVATGLLRPRTEEDLSNDGFRNVIDWMEQVPRAVSHIEMSGLLVDRRQVHMVHHYVNDQLDRLRQELANDGLMEPSKTDQVIDYLYVKHELPITKKTASGKPSVDKAALDKLPDDHAAVAMYKEWKQLETIRSRYSLNLLDLVRADGRIHGSFNSNGTETGRWSSNNPNCFTGDTEVLTPDGWVRFDQLIDEESKGVRRKVAQWDDGVVTFVEPTSYIKQEGRDVLEIKTKTQLHFKVTPDHRMLVKNRAGNYVERLAEDYPKSSFLQPQSGQYAGGPGVCLTEADIALMCAIQADGYYTRCGAVDFRFTKDRKALRLRWALEQCGIEFSYNDASSAHRFYVSREQASRHIELLTDKCFRHDLILRMSREELDLFCTESMFWDGCWERKSMYASKHKDNADIVQAAYVLTGRRAKVRRYENVRGSVSWQVDVTHHAEGSRTENVSLEPLGKQTVYCVSVPSTYIITRCMGKCAVVGNCQNMPSRGSIAKAIKKMFVAPPGYTMIQCDLSQIEYRIAALISGDASWTKAFVDGHDLHRRNAELASFAWGLSQEEAEAMSTAEIKPYRSLAKAVGFGLLYGKGVGSLAREWGVSKAEAQKVVDAIMSSAVELDQWIEDQHRFVYANGYVCTYIDGKEARRRPLYNAGSDDEGERAGAFRRAVNSTVQGSAADFMMRSLVEIVNWIEEDAIPARLICTVHDSAIIEVRNDYLVETCKIVQSIMQSWYCGDIPLKSDLELGPSWGDLKDVHFTDDGRLVYSETEEPVEVA